MLIKISQYEERRQELIAIEGQLRSKMLIHQPAVQKFIKLAYGTLNMDVYDLAISRLNLILKFHATQEMRTPDEFRPHCPEQLSKTGQLHAIDQIDGLPIFIDHNKCVTGLGIFGPQGSGKSYVIVDVCSKIRQIDDSVKTLIIDAKGGFSDLKGYLHLDLREISFDLKPSDNAQLENFTNDFMPIFATDMGLIYSLDLLSQALDIALAQRKKIMDQTGMDPGLSLRDIFEALKNIKVHTFRKQGYYDAAFTALSLILGRTELFSCRHGVCLEWLFSKNVVLNARCLTHEFQCRFFIIFLLYWLYYKIRYVRGQNSLKQVIFIDDAPRFIGTSIESYSGDQKRTSQLAHILTVLRESRVCFGYSTQLPANVDPGVLALTRNAIVVGNINGDHNLKTIQNMMSLTDTQKKAITRFKNREALLYISGHDWPYCLHGWTPTVDISNYITENPIKPVIDIVPWHSLTDIPQQQTAEPKPSEDSAPSKPAIVTLVDNDTSTTKTFGAVDKL
ncbi:MAG TPA: DUF87 domain-containing protein, partial [Anaerohalosphaeraceae bacterium]|nr:DUF87 domain-containing protein [Anaerohalosphaeraceae bacterium]